MKISFLFFYFLFRVYKATAKNHDSYKSNNNNGVGFVRKIMIRMTMITMTTTAMVVLAAALYSASRWFSSLG